MAKRMRAPKVGTLLYEVGWKDEPPAGPVVTSYVYSGKVRVQGRSMHLLVPFTTWWGRKACQIPLTANDGLKVPHLNQMIESRWTWDEVRRWVLKVPAGPRPKNFITVITPKGHELRRIRPSRKPAR